VSRFTAALGIANAVLYEGYLLFPYTASAAKNQMRWQFGVVVPLDYARAGNGETAEQQTEVLLDCGADPTVEVLVRFLQLQTRRVEAWREEAFVPVAALEVAGQSHLSFDEAVEREVGTLVYLGGDGNAHVPVSIPAGLEFTELRDEREALRGRIVRERRPLHGVLSLAWERLPDAPGLLKLRVRLENGSEVEAGAGRNVALRTSFVSAHTLLGVERGRFLSVLDPPVDAAPATDRLVNRHTWPVLIGEQEDPHHAALVLSSPIILYDFPALAPQTNADAFDATEIDELLTLSVLSLSEAERAEARATDPRAKAIVERAERFGAEEIARLHDGALERPPPALDPFAAAATFDPFAALDVPSLDCVYVGQTKIGKNSAVRLRPKRRADVWDSFLAGKLATVRAIHQDLEDQLYVAVTVDDDPASELHEWYGRSFFFYPDEIEPVVSAS